jgi:hypothetical protein
MQFLLMLYGNEAAMQAASAEDAARVLAEFTAFTGAVQQAGVYVGSNRLQRVRTAKTIRMRDGHGSVVDGPFAETKEHLGGYYLIDVPDIATALEWAGRCPAARYGAVEVRPVWTM